MKIADRGAYSCRTYHRYSAVFTVRPPDTGSWYLYLGLRFALTLGRSYIIGHRGRIANGARDEKFGSLFRKLGRLSDDILLTRLSRHERKKKDGLLGVIHQSIDVVEVARHRRLSIFYGCLRIWREPHFHLRGFVGKRDGTEGTNV